MQRTDPKDREWLARSGYESPTNGREYGGEQSYYRSGRERWSARGGAHEPDPAGGPYPDDFNSRPRGAGIYERNRNDRHREWWGEVVDVARGRFGGVGPKGYARPNERIAEDVYLALTHDPYVDASDIEFKVEGGIVSLSGVVDSRYAKRRAELCVERLPGVHDVLNLLRVSGQFVSR